MKRKHLSLLVVLLLIASTLFPTITKADELELVEIHTCIINGVQRTLSADENGKIYLTIEGQNPKYIHRSVLDVGLDKDGTVWVVEKDTSIAFYSYDLFGFKDIVFYYIMEENSFSTIKGIESLVFETSGNQEYVTGYKTSSGETYPTFTLDEIKKYIGFSDDPTPTPSPTVPTPTPDSIIAPTPTPTPTPPQDLTPTPTPPSKTDTTTQNQQNTVKQPTVTQNSSTTSNSSNSKVSIKKSSGYTCLSVGNKVVSKYKLKKGVLTWKGTKKIKKVKQVKQVGFIKKSKNLIYITKKGKAYTISKNGKTKTILKKGAKKLIFKNGYVTKIKKKSGYTSVVNK